MYGMLLESVQHFVQLEYGEEIWNHVLREVGHDCTVFTTHELYPDTLIPRLAAALAKLMKRALSEEEAGALKQRHPRRASEESISAVFTKCACYTRNSTAENVRTTADDFMMFFGKCFVRFFSNYGYEELISSTGRHFCDFLQSMDNLHQRMRFTYPRMRSITMTVTEYDEEGANLLYKSTRKGFSHYLMGQLQEVATNFFSLTLKVHILSEEIDKSGHTSVLLRLDFDNRDYMNVVAKRGCEEQGTLPDVQGSFLMKLFPFAVMMDRDMNIMLAGDKLVQTWGGPWNAMIGNPASELLRVRKPVDVPFLWEDIVVKQNVSWEMELVRYAGMYSESPISGTTSLDSRRGSQGARSVLLKGQLRHILEINAIVFLCSPVFNDLDELRNAGLFLADLNGHGLGRELLLAGWHHCSRIELLYERTRNRSDSLQRLLKLQDSWKKRGDKLLYSMIPKEIADHLRNGQDPVLACRAYSSLCVVFCALDYVMQDGRSPFDTVQDINKMFTALDRLIDSMPVYKVETVGSVYMLVSGSGHAGSEAAGAEGYVTAACRAALGVLSVCKNATVGMHVGPAVTGVLGRKVPRYCVIGDTVNTASRMQSSGAAGRVQLSAAAAHTLPNNSFRLTPRGKITVKGKGFMETFWLEGEIASEEDFHEALIDMFQEN